MIEPRMPERFLDGFNRWYEHGIRPGSFLWAVLRNDLVGAIAKSDFMAIHQIPGIVCWLYNEADCECWGSVEKCDAWEKKRREERRATIDSAIAAGLRAQGTKDRQDG